MISGVVANAMAQQLDRVNNNPVHLRARIVELEAEVDRLKAALQAARTADIVDTSDYNRINGRPVGQQRDYARHWNVPPYTVSRWCIGSLDKQGRRSPSKLQTVMRNGQQLVYLDQPPPFGKSGRKKSR